MTKADYVVGLHPQQFADIAADAPVEVFGVRIHTMSPSPVVMVDGMPHRDGVPLWDRAVWGTRGPPWRDRLLSGLPEPEPTPFTSGGGGAVHSTHATEDRVVKRILDTTPGITPQRAREVAKAAHKRHHQRRDRR